MNRFDRPLRTVIAGFALSSLLVLGAAAAGIGTGSVDTAALRLRKEPSTDSAILANAYRGETVTLLEDMGNGWYKVRYGTLTGYMSAEYLEVELDPVETAPPAADPTEDPAVTTEPTPVPTQDPTAPTPGPDDPVQPTPAPTQDPTAPTPGPDDPVQPTPAPTEDPTTPTPGPDAPVEDDRRFGKVATGGSVLNVRTGPDTDYDRVAVLVDGTVVEITGEEDGWYSIVTYAGTEGYVSAQYMEDAEKPDTWDIDPDDLGLQIVEYAKTLLGKKYVFGATGPNAFDCSGFTYYVYQHFGYALNRGGTGQLSNGVSVEKSELQPGDLVFFNDRKNPKYPMSHVGIYVGGGQFIHASTNGYKVIISDLTTGSYARKYVYARRII